MYSARTVQYLVHQYRKMEIGVVNNIRAEKIYKSYWLASYSFWGCGQKNPTNICFKKCSSLCETNSEGA